MGPLVIVFRTEAGEASLLRVRRWRAGRPRRLCFEHPDEIAHAIRFARDARGDALGMMPRRIHHAESGDKPAEPRPAERAGRCHWNASRQAVFGKGARKARRVPHGVRGQRIAAQDEAAEGIAEGERIAVAPIAG